MPYGIWKCFEHRLGDFGKVPAAGSMVAVMEDFLAELKPLTTKNRVRVGGLSACPQLRGWVLSLLGAGAGEAAADRQEYLMRRVFDRVVAEAYQKLEERGHRQRDRHDGACLVVAAAELLGL